MNKVQSRNDVETVYDYQKMITKLKAQYIQVIMLENRSEAQRISMRIRNIRKECREKFNIILE